MKTETPVQDWDLRKPESLPRSIYWNQQYLSSMRLYSLGFQYRAAMNTGGQTFFELGPGAGLLTYMLRQSEKVVTTGDINPRLQPCRVCSLPNLPFSSRSFDVSMCFEVLEHLPFEMLESSLRDLGRLSKLKVLISLPNQGPVILRRSWKHHVLQISRLRWLRRTRSREKKLPPEHYWEIGFGAVTEATIVQACRSAGLEVVEQLRPPMFPYHHFFELVPRLDERICASERSIHKP